MNVSMWIGEETTRTPLASKLLRLTMITSRLLRCVGSKNPRDNATTIINVHGISLFYLRSAVFQEKIVAGLLRMLLAMLTFTSFMSE